MNKCIYICFIIFLLFISSLSVSAQEQHINFTQKFDNLDPKDKNEPNYAPDRIIVRYKKGTSPLVLSEEVEKRKEQRSTFTGRFAVQLSNLTLGVQGKDTPEVKLDTINNFTRDKNIIGVSVSDSLEQARETYVYTGTNATDINVAQLVKDFNNLAQVEYAEPDYVVYALSTPNDTNYNLQWNLPLINTSQAWDLSTGSANGTVKIAVIDTGIAWDHTDIDEKLVGVYDCRSFSSCTSNTGYDGNTHGTHVAGTAAAETNNSRGIAGVGYNTKLITLKALNDNNSGYTAYIQTALYKLIDSYPGSRIVINMSIGGPHSQTLQNAITAAHNAGFVIVAAAGNDNTDTKSYPAGYTEVISVASVGPNNSKSSFSNWSPSWVHIAAPGGELPCSAQQDVSHCILSTTWVDDINNIEYLGIMAGTSMASPHVAGVAALVWAKNPSFTNIQVRNALQSTADPISGTGTYWKYGKLNAYQALLGAPTPTFTPIPTNTNTPVPTNTLTPSPTSTSTPTPTPTAVPTVPPTATPSVTITPTNTPSPTNTPTPIPTDSPIPTATQTLIPTPTIEACPNFSQGNADCSSDGIIGLMDFVCWKYEYQHGEPAENCGPSADFDNSGTTNLFDFVIWLAGFKAQNQN